MEKMSDYLESYDANFEQTLPVSLTQQYTIMECLSHTEDCDTILVVDKDTGRKAVAKCYPKNSILYDSQDITSLIHVKNDSIPEFISEFLNDNYHVILREYVEGDSLNEYINTHTIDEKTLVDLAKKLVCTMRILHASEPVVIHRDIKPQNIIIRENGSIALIDFGISRILKEGESSDTIVGGTAPYAPPEQYGFRQTDIRSDIYSYGVVLSWMLSNIEETSGQTIERLQHIAKKCMEFSPEKRYKNDDALLADLKRAEEIAAGNDKRKNLIYIGVALAVCVVGMIIGVCIGSSSQGIYHFKEPLIEEAVRLNLERPDGKLTEEDLKNVTDIYMIGNMVYASEEEYEAGLLQWYDSGRADIGDVSELSDLEAMPNLKVVKMAGEDIADITDLKELQALEVVDFQQNHIQDIDALANKAYLRQISINHNPLNSIEAIRTCPSIISMDLRECGSFDGSPFSEKAQMEFLDIVTDTDAYLYFSNIRIRELKLGAPGQTELGCLSQVKDLMVLHISYSDIEDISALSGREDIRYLYMQDCKVEDPEPLFTMPNLEKAVMDRELEPEMERLITLYGNPVFEIEYTE